MCYCGHVNEFVETEIIRWMRYYSNGCVLLLVHVVTQFMFYVKDINNRSKL